MNILGVSCYYHDGAAALLQDGELLAAAEEERFSRIKHDARFPRNAIEFCLETGKIRGTDLDYAVFFEKPFRKLDRILTTVLQTYPSSCRMFRESMIGWTTDKLWIASTLQSELGISRNRVLFSEHHLSHAASAFLCSPFRKAAVLTVDGVGEWTTTSYGLGADNEVRLTRQIEFPHSLGLLYSAFTAFLGFEVNEGEYKVMGMAAYGEPRYADKVWRLVRQNGDGSFSLDMNYFCFHQSTENMFNERFTDLFGRPRASDMPFFAEAHGCENQSRQPGTRHAEIVRTNQYYADLAASVQSVTEELLLGLAQNLQRETGQKRLCIAGGVGLNSVANSRMLRETDFEEIFVQPAAGDGGGALGAALWAYNSLLGRPRNFCMEHAYWGKGYDPTEIEMFLTKTHVPHSCIEDTDDLIDRVVTHLVNGKVVGWFQGRFEWGPRALGNRSILADPRNATMRDTLNMKVKFREPFRPFAPSVLVEDTESYFDLPQARQHYPARYMQYVVPTKQSQRGHLPAVTHVDGTARLQTVAREQNPRYYALLERFGEATGIPALLNTSFNLKGEPIVNSPEEAMNTFARSDMDCLVLGDFLIEKSAL
jgi:carbamoyltransferase